MRRKVLFGDYPVRILVLFLGASALLAGLVLLAGLLLPATREGRAQTVIAASPDQILAVIADVASQPEWRAVKAVSKTESGWIETPMRGEQISFIAEEMIATRVRLRFSSAAGLSGAWEAVMEQVPGGTLIRIVERTTSPSPIGRITARLFFDPTSFAEEYLAALKARVEA
jgi:hypothetical protein